MGKLSDSSSTQLPIENKGELSLTSTIRIVTQTQKNPHDVPYYTDGVQQLADLQLQKVQKLDCKPTVHDPQDPVNKWF